MVMLLYCSIVIIGPFSSIHIIPVESFLTPNELDILLQTSNSASFIQFSGNKENHWLQESIKS